MELLTLQPNRLSGRFNLADGIVFIQFLNGEYEKVRLAAQSFENTLEDATKATVAQLQEFFVVPGLATVVPETAHPTIQWNTSGKPVVIDSTAPAQDPNPAPEPAPATEPEQKAPKVEETNEPTATPEPAPATEPEQGTPTTEHISDGQE